MWASKTTTVSAGAGFAINVSLSNGNTAATSHHRVKGRRNRIGVYCFLRLSTKAVTDPLVASYLNQTA